MPQRILIADDQQDVLDALRLLLKGHGYSIETVHSPAEMLAAVERQEFDILLMDLNYARDTTSGREGLDVLSRLHAIADAPPVVAMTGWATVGLAVEAMQYGVSDFVEKPWTNSRLLEILGKQIGLGRERRELRAREAKEKRAQLEAALHQQEQEREIAEARAIQEKLLPREIPQLAGYEIASAWQSARLVGGDYFDILPLDERTLGLCIADVAGKGMPAALLMPRCWSWPPVHKDKRRRNRNLMQMPSEICRPHALLFPDLLHCSNGFSLATHTANPSMATGSMPASRSVSRTKR